MRSNKIQDERILFTRREIQSRAYVWLVYGLMISVIVQQFFMKAPFIQYAVELYALMGCGLYMLISHFNKGVDIINPRGDSYKKLFLNIVISAIMSVILFAFLDKESDIKVLGSYFVTFILFFTVFRFGMIAMNNKKQQDIDRRLNSDDDI